MKSIKLSEEDRKKKLVESYRSQKEIREQIKGILEEYAGQMVCRGLDTLYNDDEEIDEVVDMIMKVVKK